MTDKITLQVTNGANRSVHLHVPNRNATPGIPSIRTKLHIRSKIHLRLNYISGVNITNNQVQA